MGEYTISQVSELLDLPVSTIRFYDKEGLLPFIERKNSGYRIFRDSDIEMLKIVDCLKSTGMPIKDIKQFTEWVKQGDASLSQRYNLFVERRLAVEKQIKELQQSLKVIDFKRDYYKKAIEAGTEDVHKNIYLNKE